MLLSFLIAAGIVLLLVVLRAYSYAEDTARHLARAEFDRVETEDSDTPLAGLSEDDFINYFEWLRKRRFWLYFLVFAGISAPSSLVAMAFLSLLKVVRDPGPWLWGFIAIFVLVGVWTASTWATLYIYRTRRDGSLVRNLTKWSGRSQD
jgi:hypothetical protein